MTYKELVKIQADRLYATVPDWIKEDTLQSLVWATRVLNHFEGTGHFISLSGEYMKEPGTSGVVCSFAKSEWPGDHCSEARDTGSDAVVWSVCEYFAYEHPQDNSFVFPESSLIPLEV